MYKVCVVTATRAEYGLLRPLLFKLKGNKNIDLQLVVTGTHLLQSFGNTKKEIEADGFTDYIAVPLLLEDDSRRGMASATGFILEKISIVLEDIKPDLIVILGDRFEMLGVAIAAYLMRIPIAHMCGGDVTEGAVDDAIRHCITKLSTLHFPGCEQSANRIIQMGEEPSRVYNVGEPGVENCVSLQLLAKEDLANQIGFQDLLGDYCVVTFHPVTMENDTAKEQIFELIRALDAFDEMSYIITKANADAGGRIINEVWETEGAKHGNWHVVSSLGVVKYLSAVKHSKLVIGNSSSGLVEVPALGVPTINIGDRQKGRMMAKSVICCDPIANEIKKAMELGLSDKFREIIKNEIYLPFGDGHTSSKVMNVLLAFLKQNAGILVEKRFYDIQGWGMNK